MIANFLSSLGGSTDSMAASFLKPELEKHLSGIGSVQNIELDTPNKRASVTLAMQGDPNPVKIQIERCLGGEGTQIQRSTFTPPRLWTQIESAQRHLWIHQMQRGISGCSGDIFRHK